MIKILYVTSTLQSCGPTNQLFNLIKYLDRDAFAPQIITLSPEPSDSRKADFASIRCPVCSLGLSRLQGFLYARQLLQKALAELSPDIIHTQGIRADVLSSRLSTAIPKICTIRNFPQVDYPMTYGRIKGALMAACHGKTFTRLSLCVGVSESVVENVRREFGAMNVEAIENGIDDDLFQPVSTSDRSELRKRLSIDVDDKVVVSVGALNERKDPLTIMKALQVAKGAWTSAVFLGEGPLYSDCEHVAMLNKTIRLQGAVSNVAEYIRSADLFVSASYSEGLPNSVLEAMACGVPTILSDIGPHREVLPEKLHSRLLFPVGDWQSLAARIRNVMSGDLEALGHSLHLHFTQWFSARRMSERYQVKYQQLLGR